MSLFERARRLYLRATTHPVTNSQFASDTARCAAGCGVPLILGEPHYSVARLTERLYADGESDSLQDDGYDGDDLAYVHIHCWPTGDRVTLRVLMGGPDFGSVSKSEAAAS